jgi:hypothetical protein
MKTRTKKALVFSIFFFSVIVAQAQNFYACGTQTGVWQFDSVFIDCDVYVPVGAMLQIMPGTKVIFRGHYALHVQGVIKAIGSVSDSIVFTVADTTGFGNIHSSAGGWNGLRFEYTPVNSDTSLFSHCVFSYGKAVGDSVNCYGGVLRALHTDKIAFRSCTFDRNYSFYWGGAIFSYKTNVLIEHCRFLRNHAGNDGMIYGYGGALCYILAEPDISDSYFAFNSSTGIGGAASFEYSRPMLMNSIFESNNSGLGGAIGFLRSVPNRPIANLLIRDNSALFFGGGIASISASPVMTNLTIVNNYASMGGGYYCNYEAHAKLYNSILWGNSASGNFGSQVWIWDVNSVPEFHHSAVQYGVQGFGGSTFIGVYNNCIEDDPQFLNPIAGNFHLASTSPCLNTGTTALPAYALPAHDLSGLPRVMYGLPDMGAYEYQGYVGLADVSSGLTECVVVPNPNNGMAVLVLPQIAAKVDRFVVYELSGRMVAKLSNPITIDGHISLQDVFSQPAMRPGAYLLHLVYSDGSRGFARMFYSPSSR